MSLTGMNSSKTTFQKQGQTLRKESALEFLLPYGEPCEMSKNIFKKVILLHVDLIMFVLNSLPALIGLC